MLDDFITGNNKVVNIYFIIYCAVQTLFNLVQKMSGTVAKKNQVLLYTKILLLCIENANKTFSQDFSCTQKGYRENYSPLITLIYKKTFFTFFLFRRTHKLSTSYEITATGTKMWLHS